MNLSFKKLSYLWLSFVCFYTPISHCQTVYTWTDEQGHLYFSDTPKNDQAKALKLPDHQQPAPPPQVLPAEPKPQKSTKQDQNSVTELELSIISPQHDQALRSNAGFITLQGKLNRKLSIGEQLQLVFNGKKFGAPQHQPMWELRNVDRGSHSFMIQAFRDGKLIASSTTILVHLQRAIVKPATLSLQSK